MTAPLVSIPLATRNRGALLGETLRSIFSQDVPLEVIIVRTLGDTEAPSVPETADPRVRYIVQCDRPTAAAAFNLVPPLASAPWLLHWSDDDLMIPGALKTLLNLAQSNRSDCLAARFLNIGPETHIAELPPADPPDHVDVVPIGWRNVVGPYAKLPVPGWALYRSELALGIRWKEGVQFRSPDRYFALEAFARSTNPMRCDVSILAYRSHGDQVTRQWHSTDIEEMYNEWLAWAIESYPEMHAPSIQRLVRAERLLLRAQSAYAARQPWKVGRDAVTMAALTPRVMRQAEWWQMLGHSGLRGFQSSVQSMASKLRTQ
ncbi:MAG: glycosyltransferase family 2 protein [Sulfobacillus sp.]